MRLQWIILFCCSCFGILNTQMPPPIPPRSSSLARFGSRGYGSRIPSITKETIEMREKSLHRSVTTSPITTQMPKVIEVPKIFTKTVEQKAASEVPETKAAMIKIPEIGAVSAKKADYLDDKLEEAYKEFEDSLKLFEPTPRERLTHLREVKLNKFTNIGALSEKADYDGLRNQSELVIIEDLKEKMLPNSSHSNQLETKNDFCIEKFLKELDAMATEYENFLKRREDIQLEMLSSPEIDSTSPELESSDDSESDYMAMLDSLNITQSNDSNEKETDWKQIAYSVFGG